MPSDDDPIIEFLVVDDEQIMRTLVFRSLRTWGVTNIVSVSSGHEALRIMREQRVQFVITDWLMPQMTGIELVRVVRQDPQLFTAPMLILTGINTAEAVMCAMEEGADGFLVKPFSPANLMKNIRSIQQRKADPLQTLITAMARLKLQGAYDEAINIGKEILKRKKDANVLFMLGECLAKNKQYSDAIESLEESAQMEKCGKSQHLIGKIYLEQGDQEQGIEHMEVAAQQCPLILDRKVDLAEAYFKSGQDNEAEAVIDTILRSNPTNLILASLGRIYVGQGDLDKAKSLLKTTAIPTAETAHIFNNYAIALRKLGQYKESEAIYRRCIELVPNSRELYFNGGIVYYKMEDYPKAQAMFEKALALAPDYKPARVYLETVIKKIASQEDEPSEPAADTEPAEE